MGTEIRQTTGPSAGNELRLNEDKTGNTVGYTNAQGAKLASKMRFSINRTDPPGTVKGYLPPSAMPTGLRYAGSNTSNCSTTATIVVGLDTTSNALLTATAVQIALTGLGQFAPQNPAGAFTPYGLALSANEHAVTAGYAEAGTTSTAGGPWVVEIDFDVP